MGEDDAVLQKEDQKLVKKETFKIRRPRQFVNEEKKGEKMHMFSLETKAT
jgi:hypothetical protein